MQKQLLLIAKWLNRLYNNFKRGALMDKIIERKYYLRTSDFDRFRKMKPSSIMDLFQDAASCHAEQLGCGFDDLISKDMMWVLVRVKFTVVAMPQMFSQVCVRTWPLEPTRAGFRREYRWHSGANTGRENRRIV